MSDINNTIPNATTNATSNEIANETANKTDRDKAKAEALLHNYIQNPSLRQHCYAVEAVMHQYAEQYQEDVLYWSNIGLLHDIDWELYPQQHCQKTAEILKEQGYSKGFIHAIMSHGYQICTDVAPEHQLEKLLYASDELTGLILACVLVRPSKSILDLELRSVKKKWSAKAFAAGANREIIDRGAHMAGIERDKLINDCLDAMKRNAERIGIA